MKSNKRLIRAFTKIMENNPDIEIGKFIRYISSVSDLAYMTDEDLAVQVENYNLLAADDLENYYDDFKPDEIWYFDETRCMESYHHYDFIKENEQISYQRYKSAAEGKIFFDLFETINMKEFMEKFGLVCIAADVFKDITVINHKDTFLDSFPATYRHMNGYVVARKADKYIAKHVYLAKNPCFGELMEYAMRECKDEYDECLVIAIDWAESPRFTDYTKHIMYGMEYRKKDKIVEIYNDNQTIEKFHNLFQKANKIVSDWDGVLYDDGTCNLE